MILSLPSQNCGVEPLGLKQADRPVGRLVYNGGGTGAHRLG